MNISYPWLPANNKKLKITIQTLYESDIFFIDSHIADCYKENAYSQATIDKKQQFASIGNFPLENGKQINGCKIGFRTFGKLNAKRSNAVIYPTGGGSTTYG
jgi:hypothetical protein